MKTKLRILKMIREDIEKDVRENEGKAFNGRNVSILFSKQAAIIDALARILSEVIKENQKGK